jgi:general secretion pathway protein G
MQTTSKIFVSFLLCLALSLVSGCGVSLTPAEQAEVDKYIKAHGRDALARYLYDIRGHNNDEKIVLKYCKYFVSQGADVNAKFYNGNTALDIAKGKGHTDLVKYLSDMPAKSQRQDAFTYVKMLANEIERYATDVGRVPSTEQGLVALVACPSDISSGTWGGPYIKDTATSKDPWGNKYQYTSPGTRSGKEFDIWSFGPDLVDGTADDIGSWMSTLDY